MKTKKILLVILSIILVFACRYAGRVEFTDDVIGSMDDSTYKIVLSDLGGTATDAEIAAYYVKYQKHYDSIK
ncbi:hypothetical protein [uncultured Bacteroides sp.]|uniref:hypothetical protein n=1 Tax=uncultured Bacteroides sp. TaxID=162156 RepID=UPI002AA8F5A8|nr:hypothetical protein [uncultured Bacteroides sp.]